MKNNDGKYFLKAKEVVNIYDQLVVELFENMIKRLKARGNQDLIDNPYIWQLEKLNDMHLLTEDNVKLIAKRSGIAEDIFRDVIANEGFKMYKDLHEQLQNDLGIEQEINYKVQQSLNALVDQTMFDINNLLNTTLPNSVQSLYKRIVEQISANVIAGTKSQDKAISEAIMQSFENGFIGFRDKAGRNWRADSYIRTVINTTTRRVFREIREQSAEDLGIDTFYYSFKAAAREMCLPIQHRIVTKGITRKINGETVYSLSDYGYGTPAGCLGINCGHYLTPFVVGVNKKPDLPEHLAKLTDEDLLNNAKAQARQRAFEREIRKSKEKIYLAKALEDKELIQKHTLRLKNLKGGLKKLIEDNPFLYRDYARERNHFNNKRFVKDNNKIYNKYMKNYNLDLMAKSKEFSTKNAEGERVRFSAKKVQGTSYDIWVQGRNKKYRGTLELLKADLDYFNNVPRIVVVDENKLKGFAGYNYKQDVLYVSNALNSYEVVEDLLSDRFFAAENFKDVLTHELAHKKHWDSAKRLYKSKKKRYNSIEKAKKVLDERLVSYVNMQVSQDPLYLHRISNNALIAYHKGNINELVADVAVLDNKLEDKELLNKVKGVLKWK